MADTALPGSAATDGSGDDLYEIWRDRAVAALTAAVGDDERLAPLVGRIEATPPRDARHGDITTNAALIAARAIGQEPRALAGLIARELASRHGVAAETAGPGFVNIRLDGPSLRATLGPVLRRGERFGDSQTGAGVVVNLEYVSTNPTGPMHVGHCRGAVVGDALAALLEKTGHTVVREFYVNDAGAQVAALAWAVYWRVLQALGSTLDADAFDPLVPGGLQYRGDYLVPVGAAIAARHGAALAGPDATPADPSVWFDIVRAETLDAMLDAIRDDLAALGVRHDVFTSERALFDRGAVGAAIDRLAAADLLYEGVLEPPKGKLPDDWEPRPQLLFRATRFGDDVDRALRKGDGTNTYFANDIGYHADKLARGAAVLIDVLGADHGGYVARMRAAVRALGGDAVGFEVVLCQIVHLMRGGEPVRMSKRAGQFVTARELVDEVGRDAVRFTMLTRRADAQMEFDLALAVAATRDNPVFYVQYAHARCRSVLRAAVEMFGADAVRREALATVPLDDLADEAELALIRRIAAFPRLVAGASDAREPHRIAFFLGELAADFHALWNRGTADATLRFLRAEAREGSLARLALVEATATTLRAGLGVLGVEPAEELR